MRVREGGEREGGEGKRGGEAKGGWVTIGRRGMRGRRHRYVQQYGAKRAPVTITA